MQFRADRLDAREHPWTIALACLDRVITKRRNAVILLYHFLTALIILQYLAKLGVDDSLS
jgi:hypothetical protein